MTSWPSGLRTFVTLLSVLGLLGFSFLGLLAVATHHPVASNLAFLGALLAGIGMARALDYGTERDSKVRRRKLSESLPERDRLTTDQIVE